MGIYDSCSSACLWDGYLLDFALRTVIKKNYILVYMKKKFGDMLYNDLKIFARVLFRNRLKNKLNVYNVRI